MTSPLGPIADMGGKRSLRPSRRPYEVRAVSPGMLRQGSLTPAPGEADVNSSPILSECRKIHSGAARQRRANDHTVIHIGGSGVMGYPSADDLL